MASQNLAAARDGRATSEQRYAHAMTLAHRLLAVEATGDRIGLDAWVEFEQACDKLELDARQHYFWLRGTRASHNGRHGPFHGCRCIYCGSNDLDVDIYTLDPDQCPPVWDCGAKHPSDRLARCQLDPQHHESGDPHAYTRYAWPQAPEVPFDGDPVDAAPADDAAGPPARHVLTWPL